MRRRSEPSRVSPPIILGIGGISRSSGGWIRSPTERSLRQRRLPATIKTSEIHGDTLIEAQRGANMFKAFALTEKGDEINGVGDPMPNLHDMLTGSTPDGRAFPPGEDRTCNNWTSNDAGAAQVGHSDRIGHGNQSWNSSHATTGCSQEDFASWNGAGLFYCFAID